MQTLAQGKEQLKKIVNLASTTHESKLAATKVSLTNNTGCVKCIREARNTAQWIKCLLCEHKVLSVEHKIWVQQGTHGTPTWDAGIPAACCCQSSKNASPKSGKRDPISKLRSRATEDDS